MRKPSLWLAIGIGVGAAINDSAVALLVGVLIALAPWIGLAALDAWIYLCETWWRETFWREIEEERERREERLRALSERLSRPSVT